MSREDELVARRLEDIDDFDSVEDVRGRVLTITITVHSANNLPERSCRHPQVRKLHNVLVLQIPFTVIVLFG